MADYQSDLTPLGKEIKYKMLDLGLTQKQLAAEAGTTPAYLAHIMYGRRTGDKYIHKIGKILDIDVNKYVA